MKKIISLLLFCTLACGCSVQYDLTIDEQSAKESVTAFVPYTESTKQNIDIYATQKIPSIANGQSDTFYATTATLDDNNYVLNYTYNHSLNSISNSYFIANCYRGTTVSQDENSIIIKGGNQMTCINGDDGLNSTEIAVNITTQLKVIENNADKINNSIFLQYIQTRYSAFLL